MPGLEFPLISILTGKFGKFRTAKGNCGPAAKTGRSIPSTAECMGTSLRTSAIPNTATLYLGDGDAGFYIFTFL